MMREEDWSGNWSGFPAAVIAKERLELLPSEVAIAAEGARVRPRYPGKSFDYSRVHAKKQKLEAYQERLA